MPTVITWHQTGRNETGRLGGYVAAGREERRLVGCQDRALAAGADRRIEVGASSTWLTVFALGSGVRVGWVWVRALVRLDILGRAVALSPATAARLRDLAAARAGQSSSQRDLSLVLDRAVRTGATVALRRGEARALLELVEGEPTDSQLDALRSALRAAL